MSQAELYNLRRRMGMLFQFGALFTDISVFDNVAYQMREHTDLPEELIRDMVLLSLQGVSLNMGMASAWLGLLLLSLTHVVQLSIYLLFGAVLVQAIMSFVAPYNPLMPILDRLTHPLLKPLQKLLPPIGGIDLTPMILILVLQLILMVPVVYAENGAFALLRSAASI